MACVGYLELGSYMLYLLIRRQTITKFSPCSSYTLTLLPAQLPPKIKFALELKKQAMGLSGVWKGNLDFFKLLLWK